MRIKQAPKGFCSIKGNGGKRSVSIAGGFLQDSSGFGMSKG